MALHHDLLAQARRLVTNEPRRPKQASLRRAISAAYYALFHLLVAEGARQIAPGKNPAGLREAVARTFVHTDMFRASKQFAEGSLKAPLKDIVTSVPPELRQVANVFADLQQARHEADYDVTAVFTRSDALEHVKRAEAAFDDWRNVGKHPASRAYLLHLLLHGKWKGA